MTRAPQRRPGQRGQAVVLLAVGGVAMMAMAGLALDAGFEAGRYRVAQNAADAAALQDANQIFAAEIKHAAAPSLDQLETTADSVIHENHAIPGRVAGGGGAGSGGSGSGSSTPPPPAVTVTSTLPPVWKAGSPVSASAALASASVTDTVSNLGVSSVVTDSLFGVHNTASATVPDPTAPTPASGTAMVDLADNNVSETDNLVPVPSHQDSVSCSQASFGTATPSCPSAAPIPLPNPLTITDVGTVAAQTPQAWTDAAGNPVVSGTDDVSDVDLGQLGILTVTGDVSAQTVVAANAAFADVSLLAPVVTVSIPGVVTVSLSIPSASIAESVLPVGTAAYHLERVSCAVGGTLTVAPAVGAPFTRSVSDGCDVGSLPGVPGVTLGVVAGTSDALPGVACVLGTPCQSGPGCVEQITVSATATGAGATVCLGSANAVSTLVAASTYTLGVAPGTAGSGHIPSSAADNGVSVDAYIDSPTFFLKVIGLTGTDPTATASAQIQSVSDVADADFTGSPYVMPMFATRMDGTGARERLVPGHEYYVWGSDMCTDSPITAWCAAGGWAGRATPAVPATHSVGSLLLAESGAGSGPSGYRGSGGLLLMPVVDATGRVAYYGEFHVDSAAGGGHWATLVNSDPALGGHLVQAPSSGPYNPYGDGAATIRLTN